LLCIARKKKGATCYNWCKDLLATFLAGRDKNSIGARICTHRKAKNKNAYGLFPSGKKKQLAEDVDRWLDKKGPTITNDKKKLTQILIHCISK
jgi:hypothetical protein